MPKDMFALHVEYDVIIRKITWLRRQRRGKKRRIEGIGGIEDYEKEEKEETNNAEINEKQRRMKE